MFSKAHLVAGFFIAISGIASASTAIGTASAPGNMRVDGYQITGNATLFDGTAIQTAQATATLRLVKGTEIKLATNSMGMLFRDHMVLQHGKTELVTSDPYLVEASGFRVIPSSPRSRAVVSINDLGNIQVASVSGDFQVTNGTGYVVGRVRSGSAMSFMMQAVGSSVTLTGMLSKSDGHFFLTDANGTLTELVGKNVDKYVGKQVTVTGTMTDKKPDGGATSVVDLSGNSKIAAAAVGGAGGTGVGGAAAVVIAGAAGLFGIEEGIYQANKTTISR